MFTLFHHRGLSRERIIDLVVIIAVQIISTIVTLVFHPSPMVSTFIANVIPVGYLVWRFNDLKIVKKVFWVSVSFGLFITFALNVFATINNTWRVHDDLVPIMIFGLFPLVDLVWYFSIMLFALLSYERFCDRPVYQLSNHHRLATYPAFVIFVVTILLLFINPDALSMRYAYLVLGTVLLLPPLIYLVVKKPNFVHKLFWITVLFAVFNLAFELAGRAAGQWSFPGEYIGTVTLLGIWMPFEEFFFFVVLSVPALLAYYELFFDDGK